MLEPSSHSPEASRGEYCSPLTPASRVTVMPTNRNLFIYFLLCSALEIQSSGRKNELRVISGSLVETFPFRLADGGWHRLAISFSASQVEILVDCNPLYRRVLRFDPATAIFSARNVSLWIGQRTTSHFLYQVSFSIKCFRLLLLSLFPCSTSAFWIMRINAFSASG